jgi:hypothetical protein
VNVPGNEESRRSLESLCARLTDDDLSRRTGGGWTVAATLAHLGFWDRVTLERWKLLAAGRRVEFIDDLVNAAAAADWHAVPRRDAVRLALEAARVVDRHIAQMADDLAGRVEPVQGNRLYERFRHRNEHIADIEAALTR